MFRPTRNTNATFTTAACFAANQQQQQQLKKQQQQRQKPASILATIPALTTTTLTDTAAKKASAFATRIYRNDPYNTRTSIFIEKEIFAIPDNTLHRKLSDKVSFIPYPESEFVCPAPSMPRENMTRLFLGQLPYAVTDMQLQWLCYTFGNKTSVYFPERILKKDPNSTKGARMTTGCIHCYCHPDDVERLMDGLHKRLLVDDTGVWHARTEGERVVLTEYTTKLKQNPKKRPLNRPYDSVVVQNAVSTFVPKPPVYNGPKKVPVLSAAAAAAAAFNPAAAANAPAFFPASFKGKGFNGSGNNNNFNSNSNGSVNNNSVILANSPAASSGSSSDSSVLSPSSRSSSSVSSRSSLRNRRRRSCEGLEETPQQILEEENNNHHHHSHCHHHH